MSRFATVLVANRGEVAARIIRAVQAAGLQAIAAYSDGDRGAPHVISADAAVRLGPTAPAGSYLSVDAVIEAARRSGAEAIHPGYGFLAESPALARACQRTGIVFVGPPTAVIERMASKDTARLAAHAAAVPLVPGIEGVPGTVSEWEAAHRVGYPLMVKAAAGGGGKGMRIVREPGDLEAAVAAARREASAAFGEDSLIVERLVECARHVEVQILADAHGAVLHLFERDCSLQRRYQKVIEEAPASTIADSVREELAAAAVRLARAVGYVNAGTVEFLVEGERFYFLEMNTRLQVEHPVTEAVTGVDLVAWQLRIAAGQPLTMRQEDLSVTGHAFEARLYAEDPEQGFLPQAGAVTRLCWPEGARLEAGIATGDSVHTAYDPLIAKLVVSGPSREAARRRLVTALDDTAVFGLTTNTGFLRRAAASLELTRGEIDTGWLDRNPGAFLREPEDARVARVAAAWLLAARAGAGSDGPFAAGDGWRLAGPPAPVRIQLAAGGGEPHLLTVDSVAGTVREGERTIHVAVLASEDGRHLLELDGTREVVHVDERADAVATVHRGVQHLFRFAGPDVERASAEEGDGEVTASMPGTVVAVPTEAGRRVAAGDALVVIEAMKMEMTMVAPFDGTVALVAVAQGDQVALDALLVKVERDAADA